MTSSGPWWASPLIALAGSVLGVVLTLVVTGRRDARSRFGDEKRMIYAGVLLACARLRDTAVWSTTSQPGADTGPVLDDVRTAAMHAVLTAHRDTGRELATVVAAAERLAAETEEIRHTSKPGYHGAVDERLRVHHQATKTTLSTALNAFTRAARADLNVRTPLHDPFPAADPNT